jgi:hypothetical protein
MKTTSNGRPPQNIKSWISQQPLIRWPQNIKNWISQQPIIGSSSNLKHKLRGPNQNQNAWNKGPPMKDDLKILKVLYLSNHWSDLPQIWNITSEEQPK